MRKAPTRFWVNLLRWTVAHVGLVALWWKLAETHDAERLIGFSLAHQVGLAVGALLTLFVWFGIVWTVVSELRDQKGER